MKNDNILSVELLTEKITSIIIFTLCKRLILQEMVY